MMCHPQSSDLQLILVKKVINGRINSTVTLHRVAWKTVTDITKYVCLHVHDQTDHDCALLYLRTYSL
jgi:hypothetical protein